MYVRFVSTRQHPDTGVQVGIFQTRRLLASAQPLGEWDAARLAALKEWFNQHLESGWRARGGRTDTTRR